MPLFSQWKIGQMDDVDCSFKWKGEERTERLRGKLKITFSRNTSIKYTIKPRLKTWPKISGRMSLCSIWIRKKPTTFGVSIKDCEVRKPSIHVRYIKDMSHKVQYLVIPRANISLPHVYSLHFENHTLKLPSLEGALPGSCAPFRYPIIPYAYSLLKRERTSSTWCSYGNIARHSSSLSL